MSKTPSYHEYCLRLNTSTTGVILVRLDGKGALPPFYTLSPIRSSEIVCENNHVALERLSNPTQ